MAKTINRQRWDFHADTYSVSTEITKDRDALINQYFMYMLARTRRMFVYEGLEQEELKDTFSIRRCEEITQTNGYSFLVKIDKEMNGYPKGIYCMSGYAGGISDPNGLPTEASITNVALGYNKTGLKIGKDVILYPNDSMFEGLTPMFSIYANLLADIDISLRYALVNSRIPWIVQASNVQAKNDIDLLYKDIEEGKKLCSAIASNPLFDSIKNSIVMNDKKTLIKELIEAKQYIKANWYIDNGLQSNYNMKREAINSSESGMNESTLMPFTDDMLESRNESWVDACKLWGLKKSVKLTLGSAWKVIHDEYKHQEETFTEDVKEDDKEKTEDENNENQGH